MAIYRNTTSKVDRELEQFKSDVLVGLSSDKKYLSSKYFYDDEGSRIFQEIMAMPEYYLTNCEDEILKQQGKEIGRSLGFDREFNVVELGAGDGTKTHKLLQEFVDINLKVKYLPIDVSMEALLINERNLLNKDLKIEYELMCGDYFDIIQSISNDKPTLFLFLGANIGNYSYQDAKLFLQQLIKVMNFGDKIMIGFDLQKKSEIIHNAYDDPHGITARFNKNLLVRINRELGGDIDVSNFNFKCVYDEIDGEVKSSLVSKSNQSIYIDALKSSFFFTKGEEIHTELSKKYTSKMIHNLLNEVCFTWTKDFYDKREYFMNSVWEK